MDMGISDFLSELRAHDVNLWVEGGQLCYRAPVTAMTPEIRGRITHRKEELLEYLRLNGPTECSGDYPMMPVPRTENFPLSYAQERLWFLDQLMPGSAAYNVPYVVRIRGRLEIEVLERAVEELVGRHEVLRTTFEVREGQPVQVIRAAGGVRMEVMSLEGQEPVDREMRLKEMGLREGQEPFDLEHGPLMRVKLVKLGAVEHVLFLTMHHIVSDGWSMGVLVREMVQLYEAFSKGKASPLPELPIQYADYAVWQRNWLQGDVLAEQMGYWRKQLEGAPELLELPTDRPRPAVQSNRGASERVVLGQELLVGLKALSERAGATLFMVLMAAFKVLLYRYTGQRDIVVGAPIANRKRREIEGLIGFFANTLVLRTDLSGDPTFSELLEREREVAFGAYEHQDVPFEQLVQELRPERSLGHSPLFQVMLVLQNTPEGILKVGGLEFEAVRVEHRSAKFDLTMALVETAQGMSGWLEYNTDLFDRGTIQRTAHHWERLLESVVKGPGLRIGELELLSIQERRQILEGWNETAVEYPKDKCLHELFEEQVERSPGTVAVVYEGRSLTYRELNARANQVGHYLRGLGVGPEVLVGLSVERSLEMVIGLLGILKAGGAYVPLDPGYPPERLAYMIEDAQVSVLLTQRKLVAVLATAQTRVVCLDEDWERRFGGEPVEAVKSGVSLENLLYVIYTSGSTGRPKGIRLSQGALHNLICWHQETLLRGARTLQFASLSFDASFHEIFAALVTGGTVFVA